MQSYSGLSLLLPCFQHPAHPGVSELLGALVELVDLLLLLLALDL